MAELEQNAAVGMEGAQILSLYETHVTVKCTSMHDDHKIIN